MGRYGISEGDASEMIFQGGKLRAARLSKKMSAVALHKRSGIPLSVISDLETGVTKNPRQRTVQKLCSALGVDPEFFYISGEENKETFGSILPPLSPVLMDFVYDQKNTEYIEVARFAKAQGIKPSRLRRMIDFFADEKKRE